MLRHTMATVTLIAALGACNEPTRGFVPVDVLVTPDVVAADAAPDADVVDLDAPADAARDVAGDRRNLDADVADLDGPPGDTGRDAARDIPVESNIAGCMTNDDCPSRMQYCNAGGCGGRGFCAFRTDPMSCPTVDASSTLVCGCDGNTYPSLCALQAEGVRLSSIGMCPRD